MSTSFESFIENVLNAATTLSNGSQALLAAGDAQADAGFGNITLEVLNDTATATLSDLERVPPPVADAIQDRLTSLIESISTLYSDNFPEISEDLTDRATVSQALTEIITEGRFAGPDYESQISLLRLQFDEGQAITEPRIREKWAAMGYPVAPGQMTRDLTEDYTAKFQAFQRQRIAIMEQAITSLLPQFTGALQRAQEMAINLRTAALAATADVIRAAARESTTPGKYQQALVKSHTAMADAALAKYEADKSRDEQLLKIYLANLDNEAQVNRYYANMHPKVSGDRIQMAVSKAIAAGAEAASLWNSLNIVNGQYTTSLG